MKATQQQAQRSPARTAAGHQRATQPDKVKWGNARKQTSSSRRAQPAAACFFFHMQSSRSGTGLLFQLILNRFYKFCIKRTSLGLLLAGLQPAALHADSCWSHGRAEVHHHSVMTARFKTEENGIKVSHGGLVVRGTTGATKIKRKGKDEARKPPSNSERSKDAISQDL